MGIFTNYRFYLKDDSLQYMQKKLLRNNIKKNNGIVSSTLNHKCTHIILDNDATLSSDELSAVQEYHISIANIDFLWDCLKQGELLSIENYKCNESSGLTLLPFERSSSSRVDKDDLHSTAEKNEEIMEQNKFCTEDDDITYIPQDFEVAKYSILEKIKSEGEKEVVVVELQCFQEHPEFSFLVSSNLLLEGGIKTRRHLSRKNTSEDASEYYESYVEELKKQGFLASESFPPEANLLASEKLQALMLEDVLNGDTISEEVSNLVELIWVEALGHLENILLKTANSISLNDVSKAEGILLQVKAALNKGETTEELRKMMSEFYRLIPHRNSEDEVNKRLLSKKEDLCQLIRDVINVSEANLSRSNPPSLAKYRALRCKIEHVDENTREFFKVKEEVLQKNSGKNLVDILNIYRIGKVHETVEFQSKLGNVQSLLHGTPGRNIVGILSRGLLLPKRLVEDHGIERTDFGNLGNGIYFSDSLSTGNKYSQPNKTNGTRFLVVCDVALGCCINLLKRDSSLTEPPPGYDSVHGIRRTEQIISDFEDDEFVIYKTSQVKMKYLVNFCMSGDRIKDFCPCVNSELEENRPELLNDNSQLKDFALPDTNPFINIKAGLQDLSGIQVPLEEIHIKGRIMDFIAQIIVFQAYNNKSDLPIETKYVFPLDDKAAVCGFEAFINGKHIIAEVKEKEEAHQEYREAISQGHGAYLMDQDSPGVFTVSIGNLPPQAKVLIKITYITELSFHHGCANFFMPATVAPWQQDKALNENLQDAVEKVYIKEVGVHQQFSLNISIEMPHLIELISSDTHQLKIKKTDCKAVISTLDNSTLDSKGFSLQIHIGEVYLPRMWVEKHPNKESEACMLVFHPDFSTALPEKAYTNEVIICLDCSNSMEGSILLQAKQIALHALSLVQEKQKVNIIKFGTSYTELFSYPKYSTSNPDLTEFIMSATPTMGNTDFWKTLRFLNLLYPSQGMRSILLLSDGHIQNKSLTLQIVKRNVRHTRLFTCGIGSTANRHILRTLSQYGAGAFEYFNTKSKYSWKKQIEDQMTRIFSPGCSSVSVKWQQLNLNSPEPMQAPTQIQALFNNDRLLVYGFIPHCTQAILNALIQEREFQTMVSTTELQKTTGTMLHKLTARAIIRDYEDGILHEDETKHEMKKQILKSLIIKLSKENSIITQFTSFVAVEKRDSNISSDSNNPNILELITTEDIDFLPYMDWEVEQLENIMMKVQQKYHRRMKLKNIKDIFKLSSRDTFSDITSMRKHSVPHIIHYKPEKEIRLFTENDEKLKLYSSMEENCSVPSQKLLLTSDQYDHARALDLTKKDSDMTFLFNKHKKQDWDSETSFTLSSPIPPPPPPPPPPLPPRLLANSSFSQSCSGFALHARTLSTPSFLSANSPFPPPLVQQGGNAWGAPYSNSDLPPLSPFSSSLSCPTPLSASLSCSSFISCPPPPPPPLCGAPGFIPRPHLDLLEFPRPGIMKKSLSVFKEGYESTPDVDYGNLSLRKKMYGIESNHGHIFGMKNDEQLRWLRQPPFSPSRDTRKEIVSTAFSFAEKNSIVQDVTPSLAKIQKHQTDVIPRENWLRSIKENLVFWTQVFNLQNEEGFWKLNHELGLILKLNVNDLNTFLVQKGIQSLGSKGKEDVLQLIATFLVLQLIRIKLELEGITVKSLLKLDDSADYRPCAWAWSFASVKKAVEWVRRTEAQYPSLCSRLELGKDWDSATKQLLGIQPISTRSPLHKVFNYNQG
ncbi:protein mono-ADP-ribosyltransferase PARP4 [Sarcophilus harrisii]|uniref:Poly [ADP-ribose] polymerase n=1 Tax=Sarcophilus harrisii TaxID=9305 RepID=A0A7N4PBT8_SARHA|nr:protein mono-ADP-ribosyltransferase PARP4 [Sarcophilus harrisii]XP_031816698.1 protein mono-ADP-ribosyltransferase PARP4 [Sarcophilus harrisii]